MAETSTTQAVVMTEQQLRQILKEAVNCGYDAAVIDNKIQVNDNVPGFLTVAVHPSLWPAWVKWTASLAVGAAIVGGGYMVYKKFIAN